MINAALRAVRSFRILGRDARALCVAGMAPRAPKLTRGVGVRHFLLVLLVLFGSVAVGLTNAVAQDISAEMSAELQETLAAARNPRLAYTPRDQALVLKHINEIHLLRGMGEISDTHYQNVMAWHQGRNLQIARQAIDDLKMYDLAVQRAAPDAAAWRVGSDTDFLVARKDGKPLTLEDIQAIERAYRVRTNQEIRRLGGGRVKPPELRYDTTTDFMVAHDATTPEEFARIGTHFIGKQADTYQRIEAARVEALMRTPGAKVDYLDGGMYVAEMVDQATRKQSGIDELLRRQKALLREHAGLPTREVSRIEARIRQLEYERDKYLKRINSINEHLRSQVQPDLTEDVDAPPRVSGMEDLAHQARRSYAQTLGNILKVMPDGPQAKQVNFVLALQLYDLPARQRTDALKRLDPKVKLSVEAQFKEFSAWRRAEQERIAREDVITLTNFLQKTEFGQKLLDVFNSEIQALTTRPTESSRFIRDVYRDLAAIDQTIQRRTQSLAMWLDVLVQIRDAKSDADLAIALGRTLASKTYYGMIASYAYTGLVERDAAALAKSLIIMLSPKAALPAVVQAIGSSVIDLTTSVLFDHQFMVLYATARFEDGQLTGIRGYRHGSDAVCHFVHEVLQPGGHHWVEGVFTRALELGREGNLSLEVLSGINAFGTHAFVSALQSTVYGGTATFMGDHPGVQAARAEVSGLTDTINDFASALGIEVPLQGDGSWGGLSNLEPAARQALRSLFDLRVAAWNRVEAVLCAAITERLEARHRAEMELEDEDAAVLLLAEVQRLFRALDIYELGMSWLDYEGTYNSLMRWLVVSTEEQRIRAMETLLRYHAAYSAVYEIRDSIEGIFLSASGGRESLMARPLTGAPPLTGDPAFDRNLAAKMLEALIGDLALYERLLLDIKREGLNDRQAQLDAAFDREILQQIAAAWIAHHNAMAVMDGAAHIHTRVNRLFEFGKHTLAHLKHSEAAREIGRQLERRKALYEEFEEYYAAGDPELVILPPSAVIEGRAVAESLYAFGLESVHVPQGAEYVWFVGDREIGRGTVLQHVFEEPGDYSLRVVASWEESERVLRAGRASVALSVSILETADIPELVIRAPNELSIAGVVDRPYHFRAAPAHIPRNATFTWWVDGEVAGIGSDTRLSFVEPGQVTVGLSAEWAVPESWPGRETIWATPLTLTLREAPAEPELMIIPPPGVAAGRAEPRQSYLFVAAPENVPGDAVFSWSVDGRPYRQGRVAALTFPRPGEYDLAVTASWGERSEESLTAQLAVRVAEDAEVEEVAKEPPEVSTPDGDSAMFDEGSAKTVLYSPSGSFSGNHPSRSVRYAISGVVADGSPREDIPQWRSGTGTYHRSLYGSASRRYSGYVVGDSITLSVGFSQTGACEELTYRSGEVSRRISTYECRPSDENWGRDVTSQSFTIPVPPDGSSFSFSVRVWSRNPGGSSSVSVSGSFAGKPDYDYDIVEADESVITVPDSALTVSLTGPTGLVVAGQTVALRAEVEGGTGPYQIEWTGVLGAGPSVELTPRWAGNWPVGVTVRDAEGNTGEGRLLIQAEPAVVAITGLAGQVYYGSQARLMIGGGSQDGVGIPGFTAPALANTDFRYVWQASPDLQFVDPVTGVPRTTVTYSRMGTIPLWVEVQAREGEVWHPFGESEPVEIQVVAPAFDLQFEPPEGQGRVGDEIRVRVSPRPAVAADLIDYRWLLPDSGNRTQLAGNAEEIAFVVGDDESLPMQVPLEVFARVPVHGDEIRPLDETGPLSARYAGVAYLVEIPEPRYWGPTPKFWDPERGGLADAPPGAIVTHQEVFLEARVAPVPRGELRYRWSVEPDGARVYSPGGRETRFAAHDADEYLMAVEVRNADGLLLGQASRAMPVLPDAPPSEPPVPLAMALTADRLSLPSGEITLVRAVPSGGQPPYSLQWSGLEGQGRERVFEAGPPGVHTITVRVVDAAGAALAETISLTVEPVELDVDVAWSEEPVYAGDVIHMTSVVTGGSAPYRLRWGGVEPSDRQRAVFTPRQTGAARIELGATDVHGNTGRTTVNVDVLEHEIAVELVGVSGQPRIWDRVREQLVDLPVGEFAAGQQLRLQAGLAEGDVPDDARWSWELAGPARFTGGRKQASAEIELTGQGEITAKAVLRSGSGIVMGTGEFAAPSSYSAADLQAAERRAELHGLVREAQVLEARGDLREALSRYEEALRLEADSDLQSQVTRIERTLARFPEARPLPAEALDTEAERESLRDVEDAQPSVAQWSPPEIMHLDAVSGELDAEQREARHPVVIDRVGDLRVSVKAEETLSIHLDLYDVNGTTRLASHSGGALTSTRNVERMGLAPGTYYVRVRRAQGHGRYTVTPALDAVTIAGDEEPNDTREQAQLIALGHPFTGLLGYGNVEGMDTQDWYRFSTRFPGTIVGKRSFRDVLSRGSARGYAGHHRGTGGRQKRWDSGYNGMRRRGGQSSSGRWRAV